MPNQGPEGVRPTLKRPSQLPAVVAAIAVLAGGGFLVWRYVGRQAPPPPPPPSPPAQTAPAEPEAAAVPEGPPPPPATTQGLLEAVSKDGLVRKLLAEGDVVRRWALVAANLAAGESPRSELGSLAPAAKFSVETAGGRTAISPSAYARYDAFGDAVASIDPAALASAWRALRPALQRAYRILGYPYPTIDAAMARALRRLEQAPVPEGPVLVEGDGAVYAFADPKLEALGSVEKHLLRMGPRNTRIVQSKAREVEAALGLSKPSVAAERR